MLNRRLSTLERILGRAHERFDFQDETIQIISLESEIDSCAEDGKEFGEPGGMRGPGWSGDEIAINDSFRHSEIDESAAGSRDVRTNRRIRTAPFPLEDAGGCQDLRGVADRSNRFVGLREVLNDFDHAWVEPNVFGRAAAGNNQSVILFRLDLIERGVEREIVTSLFGIGLVTFEIMNCGADVFAGFFAGTHSVNRVADHEQGLERNHHFVVFDVVADEHQNRFLGHAASRNRKNNKDKDAGLKPGATPHQKKRRIDVRP
jgi:hypothetical protein